MLPRKHRFSERSAVSHVLRMGKKAYEGLFYFVFLENGMEVSRFACVASKKLFPHAVDRNRAKRLVREALRHEIPLICPGFDGVFVFIRKPEKRLDIAIVSEDMKCLLRKTKLLSLR